MNLGHYYIKLRNPTRICLWNDNDYNKSNTKNGFLGHYLVEFSKDNPTMFEIITKSKLPLTYKKLKLMQIEDKHGLPFNWEEKHTFIVIPTIKTKSQYDKEFESQEIVILSATKDLDPEIEKLVKRKEMPNFIDLVDMERFIIGIVFFLIIMLMLIALVTLN